MKGSGFCGRRTWSPLSFYSLERFFCATHIYSTSIIQYTILKFRGKNKNPMFVIMFPFQTRYFFWYPRISVTTHMFLHSLVLPQLLSIPTVNWCLPVWSLQLCSWCEPSFLMVRWCWIYVRHTDCIYIYYTSSTAQGGGGSFPNFPNRKLIGCCESRMAERIHWWTARSLECQAIHLSIYLSIHPSIHLSFFSVYWSISVYQPIYLSVFPSICLALYLSIVQCSVVWCGVV